MEDFEQQLRNALARKQEPAGFESRVFAAKAVAAARKPIRGAFWHWAAEMTAVVLIAGGFWLRYQHDAQERIAGEAAKGRLQLALKITVTELSKIQKTVHASTEDE